MWLEGDDHVLASCPQILSFLLTTDTLWCFHFSVKTIRVCHPQDPNTRTRGDLGISSKVLITN